LQRTHGEWRSSQIVGAAVYNDRDERIGSVDDLLVGQDGKISEAVLSVGGFLGLGAKLVVVPYGQLRFEERADNQAVGSPATGGVPPAAPVGSPAAPAAPGVPAATPPARPVATTRLVLPGATRDSLRAQAEFRYRDRG
jgi:sporulation protein YlmC with PRC-barrel domain